MRYKKPSVDTLLTAIEVETSIGRLSGTLAEHLTYVHRLVHELEENFCRARYKQREKSADISVIEYVFRKLAYKGDSDE